MRVIARVGLVVAALACGPPAAWAGVGVAVGVGYGRPCWGRPCVGFGFYYQPYYPVYVAPPPVVVAPAPVVVQPAATAVQPVNPAPAAVSRSPTTSEPPLEQVPAPRPVDAGGQAGLEARLRELQSPDERTRAEAAVELGRMQTPRAVGPLIRLLKEDPSPSVRESAARGLGLIGETNALAALQYAAQADGDREVRKSAGYAAEVLRSRLPR
jgi:hypothetical protein